MRFPGPVIVIAICASASAASAQTATCMSMGPDMVHCNSSDGASTDCMRMGATMATCNTMGGGPSSSYNNDGGAALGQGLVNMIHGFNERSFRSKVGKMLAAGDCAGAVKYAFEKGRIELGTSLQQACNRQASQTSGTSEAVESEIAQMAVRARTPTPLSANLSLTQVQAHGKQLELIFVSAGKAPDLVEQRASLTKDTCATDGMLPLLRAGASIRALYFNSNREQVGAVLVAASDCGIQ